MNRKWRAYRLILLSFLGSLILSLAFTPQSQAHWADLAVAEIIVGNTETQIALTIPTGLVASADDNRDGQLQQNEVGTHQLELQSFLSKSIRLTDGETHKGTLTVKPSEKTALPSSQQVTPSTHSTLRLIYNWLIPVQQLNIHYDLFLPGVPTARCLATISHQGQVQNFIFSPESRDFSLMQGSATQLAGSFLLAIAGCFLWGAMHALSPGHGKTIVGAYLAGSRATASHAIFLGLTATITHTLGVFALGLVTLFASRFIVPEQLYPWLSFISGLMVVVIGINLLQSRLSRAQLFQKWSLRRAAPEADGDRSHHHHHEKHPHDYSHHDHSHDHSHHHLEHGHSHGDHSHLPPGADGAPVTWRSLLALGISGGIVPCPAALVVLLSATALGRVGFGLVLVLAFSLGLAGVLTGLGLLLVFAKRLFERMPTPGRVVRVLPALSALFIVLLGLGITAQAIMQIGLFGL
jgi:ABC-type nickel/cobalt efflux system permease component RcnA